MNAFANTVGNQFVPIKVLNVDAGILEIISAGKLVSTEPTGLYVSKLENNAAVAGILLSIGERLTALMLAIELVISTGNLSIL